MSIDVDLSPYPPSRGWALREIPGARRLPILVLLAAIAAGCASVPQDAGFSDVKSAVAERTGQRVHWNQGSQNDAAVQAAVRAMLKHALTADEAAQIALLNNRRLQAIYEDLSLTQANLVQAGLLSNPVFNAAIGFPVSSGALDLNFSIVQDFLSILYRPLRKAIARAEFEGAKQRVTEAVIELAAQVRSQFYHVQADHQRLEFLQRVVTATAASAEAARRLHEAGNITDLDLSREQALHQESRLALATAQTRLVQDRERLNALMGVWGEDTRWNVTPRLPEIPPKLPTGTDLEQRAIKASLVLGATRKKIEAAAGQLGFADATALIPSLEPGVDSQRDEGEWDVGPSLTVSIPFFNQGQARLAVARAQLRRARQTYWAEAVEIRAVVRTLRQTTLSARSRALYVQGVLLPLYTRIVNRTQLQYNAMQIGLFQLLLAKQRQIDAGLRYIDTLRDYWLARTALAQTLSGGLAKVET
ncbi:MAG TPA: TolC family protein, partial [Nitrococcus sp.]|nr:TolC family protein [Nitrococcus sp.]